MEQPKGVLKQVDDGARRLAKALVRAARHAALATLMPDRQTPLASRVLVASDPDGRPLLLVSHLAAHARALGTNPACSLLFGEAGDGDPLAQPRISVFGTAEPIAADERPRVRERFLARHPSAELYCDFADFRFLRVSIAGASLNAGFARAYELVAVDLLDPSDPEFEQRLLRAAAHMNDDHADAVDAIAARHGGAAGTGWRIVTADRSGFEVAREGRLCRVFFEEPLRTVDEIRHAFVALARDG